MGSFVAVVRLSQNLVCIAVKPRVETAADRSFGRTAVADSRLQDAISLTSWVVINVALETPDERYGCCDRWLSGFPA